MAERSDKTTIDASTWRPAISLSVKGTDDAEKLAFIEEVTSDVDAVQERVLAEILGRNAESEYLKECGLAGATDRASFRAKVPMVTYEDVEPYIRRIADGDGSPILTGPEYPVSEFFTSSGTSGGEPKLLPTVEDDVDRRQLLQSLLMPVMKQYVVLYLLLLSYDFLFSQLNNAPPLCVFACWWAGDGDGEGSLLSVRAAGDEDAWRPACTDLRDELMQEPTLEEQRLPYLHDEPGGHHALPGPDPDLAGIIRAECSKGDWAGIVKRIWPNTKYLSTVITGSMAQYVPSLNNYGGGLPIVSTWYASSECTYGFNLRPMCDPGEVSYTFMPFMGYFEFLPVDGNEEDASQLVDLARLEMGHEYEVVVTTYSGLNRYRVGDVLRVTGFPFCSARTEMEMEAVNGDVLDRCCLEMEEALSSVYRRKRVVDNSIGPLEIRVIRSGTFEELMDYAVSRGTSMSQYKVPRCVTENTRIIELLDSRVVSSHFSPMAPHWAPDDQRNGPANSTVMSACTSTSE
ncbi:hypothetical protein PR202_ga24847 [Eleusine coracana subsp. coracana]|uniref:Uncharacterized protein n=1 Tax=Eleusine coracana subsp. coracana TaxID=191504 RepID=A0AAV5D9Y6_ELECO|nr:hypothetical protein PR202_ga24847 [Eleusine coracana subsp. coracana]